MSKSKFSTVRLSDSLSLSALVGLSTLLAPVQNGRADDCTASSSAAMGCGINVIPKTIHLNDIVTFSEASANVSVSGCNLTNVNVWAIFPNSASVASPTNTHPQVAAMGGVKLLNGGCVACGALGNSACGSLNENPAICLVPSNSPTWQYQVTAADLHNSISFTTPGGAVFPKTATKTNTVVFMTVGEADSTFPGPKANNSFPQEVTVLFPGISITKQCTGSCPPPLVGNSVYGQPITFSCIVSNTGNTPLFGITVTDNPPATITFGLTSTGRTFDNTLNINESVSYT